MNIKRLSLLAMLGVAFYGAMAQEEHKYVDLKLPSGTLWAVENVGVDEEFQWCTGLDEYSGSTVFNMGSNIQGTANDPATQAWGDEWCTPTLEQWWELLHYVRYEYYGENSIHRVRYYDVDGDGVFDTPDDSLYLDFPLLKSTYNQNVGQYYYSAYWTSTQIMEPWPVIAKTDTCFEWRCDGIDASETINGGFHIRPEHGYCYSLAMQSYNFKAVLDVSMYYHTRMIRPVRKAKATGVRRAPEQPSGLRRQDYYFGKFRITPEGKKYLEL